MKKANPTPTPTPTPTPNPLQVKKALQSTLRDEEVKAEVLIKPVADRTKGFSELQTFNPQQAIARAKGSVWELLCFGPHDVELLSTAVRL